MPTQIDPRNTDQSYDDAANPYSAQSLSAAERSQDISEFENDFANNNTAPSEDEEHNVIRAQEILKDKEETPWATNISAPAGDQKQGFSLKALKKGGATGILLSFLIGVAGIISFFGGPGLLIVNFAEVLTEKFNYQLGSLDMRHNKIVEAKLNNTTKGVCAGKVSIGCKFSTFSDKEIERFEKSGLKVNRGEKALSGRTKITSFELPDGTKIDAKNYTSAMKSNPKFNESIKNSYRLKYAGMSDSIFNKVATKFKTGKNSKFDSAKSDEDRIKIVEEEAKSGKVSMRADDTACQNDDCTDDERKAKEKSAKEAETGDNLTKNSENSLGSVADEVVEENSELLEKGTAKAVRGTATKTVTSIIKITGPLDNACMVYGWVKTISYTAKVVRAAQMVRYSMIFLNTASMIKAGRAKPDDVAFIGNTLTKIVTDKDGKQSKAATDSFGYRYAAFGDKGIDPKASTAVAGANFGGRLQQAVNTIIGVIPGGIDNADEKCHFLNKPVVQIASGVIGIASFIFGVGEVKLTAQLAMAPIIAIVGAILPAMIGDIAAGKLVGKNTFGEASGNLITSGAGAMMSTIGSKGGNSILRRNEARAYMQLQQETLLSYAQYERSIKSPFDATSPNTFLGSLYTRFAPYAYGSNSPTNTLASIMSILSSTTGNLLAPKSFAADEGFDECKDPTFEKLGLATDPFCNPVVGIPPKYLDDDPVVVSDRLIAKGQIDEESGQPKGDYAKFVSKCIDRENPFGTSQDGEKDETEECFIDSQDEADYYVHHIDMRTLDISENDLPQSQAGSNNGTDASSSDTTYTDPPSKDGWSKPIAVAPGFAWHQNGSKGLHKGQDFPAPMGTSVTAAHDGKVTLVDNMGSCGWATVITAEGVNGIWHAYQHMNPIVIVGDTVKRGQVIGRVGTFCGTGTHLHFSIETANRVSAYADSGANDTSKNPADWIPM